jgi:phosphoglycolate phosphatase
VVCRPAAAPKASKVERAVGFYRERYQREGHRENALYAGVPEMLSELRAVSRLVVVTAKHQDSAERILEHFGLGSHFDSIFGSEPSGRLSDKKALVRHVIDALGIDRAETVLVGDRIHDVEGGRHNGIVTVGAAWGYGTGDELANADYVCNSPLEVATLLSRD